VGTFHFCHWRRASSSQLGNLYSYRARRRSRHLDHWPRCPLCFGRSVASFHAPHSNSLSLDAAASAKGIGRTFGVTRRFQGLRHQAVEGTAIRPSIDTFSLSYVIREVGGPLMRNDARNAYRFGAHDKPPCANCGNRTFLTRRSPAAAALHLERQTFTCLECDQDFERVVDARGKPVRSPALS
jgi:hypothetical protein